MQGLDDFQLNVMHRHAVMRLPDIHKIALVHLLDHSGKRDRFPLSSRIYLPGRNIHRFISEFFVPEFHGQSYILFTRHAEKGCHEKQYGKCRNFFYFHITSPFYIFVSYL
ncbi:hypothetical protein ES703_63636 [subsurface metagenome]